MKELTLDEYLKLREKFLDIIYTLNKGDDEGLTTCNGIHARVIEMETESIFPEDSEVTYRKILSYLSLNISFGITSGQWRP